MSEQAARSIRIDCPADCVLSFLGDVESLPAWTSFYKRRLGIVPSGRAGDSVRFETPLGESLTHVEVEPIGRGGRVTIVSVFAARVERAVLLVDPAGPGTRVTFLITFPDHVPMERRRLMLGQLEYELVRLRDRLEQEAARSSMLQAVP
jgi:hypothetical protein